MTLSNDLALLILRIVLGGSLFLKHGLAKLTNFSQMAQHFPDPIHIGPVPSLVFALLSDAICSVLIVLGVKTRWASLLIVINLFVAWALVHRFEYLGKEGAHGELIVLYLGGFLTLALMGPGRFSVDRR